MTWDIPTDSRVHVDIVRREIQRDEEHDQKRPIRVSLRQEAQKTGCRASIRHHVEHCPELAFLAKSTSRHAVEHIKNARDEVNGGAQL